jgi:hypothetical protein
MTTIDRFTRSPRRADCRYLNPGNRYGATGYRAFLPSLSASGTCRTRGRHHVALLALCNAGFPAIERTRHAKR